MLAIDKKEDAGNPFKKIKTERKTGRRAVIIARDSLLLKWLSFISVIPGQNRHVQLYFTEIQFPEKRDPVDDQWDCTDEDS